MIEPLAVAAHIVNVMPDVVAQVVNLPIQPPNIAPIAPIRLAIPCTVEIVQTVEIAVNIFAILTNMPIFAMHGPRVVVSVIRMGRRYRADCEE